ncbi:Glucan endo-1,3-beta-glucosidase, partial [Madurella mycetomatis]
MASTLTIQLVNHSTSSNVYAFITGLAIQRNMARVFLKADGRSLYFPESPPAGKILQPLTENCAIPLGPPGASVAVTIPQMAGGRIWFSAENKLTFLRNPAGPGGGAALVEPSVLNPTDPNADVDFAFCELTLNADQLFANITYVDFVPRLPVALTLQTRSGAVQHVSGMPPDGLERVCAGLRAQAAKDGRSWDKLVVQRRGQDRPLRALSPTHGNAVGVSFAGYFEPLVEVAWDKYALPTRPHHRLPMLPRPEPRAVLRINTQAAPGVLEGTVHKDSDKLVIGGEAFSRPTTADILGCNSGPFTTGPSPTRNAIIPRLAAAFQRSSIVVVADHPSQPETFYRCEPTNHYARIVHQCNLDGKGYAF